MDYNREQQFSLQLIKENGTFNAVGFENFLENVKLDESGVNYVVVSIIGSQSSGRSSLLNQLFGTTFEETNASKGRSQTTKGIWMANCVGIEPRTLVMDVEGTDGAERGSDDTAFEKQSTLFAFASSNIVLLNMWYNDIGRENASNKRLLSNVFQVMLTLLSLRKITLMFVIRDTSPQTPYETLKTKMKQDIEKIWDSVPKPSAMQNLQLSDFFNVEVVALSHYEYKRDQFMDEVANLRKRFFYSILPGGLVGYREGVILASGVSVSVQTLWETIKNDKSLDLPSYKVMVATTLCEEIANEEFVCFTDQNEWSELEKDAQSGNSEGFGEKLNSLVNAPLTNFNKKTINYDEGIRKDNETQLKERLLQFIKPTWSSMLESIVSATKKSLKVQMEKAPKTGTGFDVVKESLVAQLDKRLADVVVKIASWDTSDVKVKIHSYLAEYVSSKVKELEQQNQVMVATTLCEEIENEEFACFTDQNEWSELENDVQSGNYVGFGEKIKSLANAAQTNLIGLKKNITRAIFGEKDEVE